MKLAAIGEYNRDQLVAFEAVREGLTRLSLPEIDDLGEALTPYLEFRARLAAFNAEFFAAICSETCFQSGLSACCGFESIFTFFADQVISILFSSTTEQEAIFARLRRPNSSNNCVYLGDNGCVWKIPPIGCAMFFCDNAKNRAFGENRTLESEWQLLQDLEKEFTWPVKPVIFDSIEALFRRVGIDSPHMYFHKSPGLLRVKASSGLVVESNLE